jgi:hypothetical protein
MESLSIYRFLLEPVCGRYKFVLNDSSHHVDISCFARYYARSSKKEKQTVSVERLSEWTDSIRAVCFIASNDISAGSELVIATNQEYQQRNKNGYIPSLFRKVSGTGSCVWKLIGD